MYRTVCYKKKKLTHILERCLWYLHICTFFKEGCSLYTVTHKSRSLLYLYKSCTCELDYDIPFRGSSNSPIHVNLRYNHFTSLFCLNYFYSKFSKDLKCVTSAGAPSAPTPPNLDKAGINFINLSWSKPESKGGKCFDVQYTVLFFHPVYRQVTKLMIEIVSFTTLFKLTGLCWQQHWI